MNKFLKTQRRLVHQNGGLHMLQNKSLQHSFTCSLTPSPCKTGYDSRCVHVSNATGNKAMEFLTFLGVVFLSKLQTNGTTFGEASSASSISSGMSSSSSSSISVPLSFTHTVSHPVDSRVLLLVAATCRASLRSTLLAAQPSHVDLTPRAGCNFRSWRYLPPRCIEMGIKASQKLSPLYSDSVWHEASRSQPVAGSAFAS